MNRHTKPQIDPIVYLTRDDDEPDIENNDQNIHNESLKFQNRWKFGTHTNQF